MNDLGRILGGRLSRFLGPKGGQAAGGDAPA
jgi:hypothetical protein